MDGGLIIVVAMIVVLVAITVSVLQAILLPTGQIDVPEENLKRVRYYMNICITCSCFVLPALLAGAVLQSKFFISIAVIFTCTIILCSSEIFDSLHPAYKLPCDLPSWVLRLSVIVLAGVVYSTQIGLLLVQAYRALRPRVPVVLNYVRNRIRNFHPPRGLIMWGGFLCIFTVWSMFFI